MKRAGLIALILVFAVLAISVFLGLNSRESDVPEFRKAPPPRSAKMITYDFLGSRPFEAGKMWIGADRGAWIYDLERRQILGQLTNAWPVVMFGDPPQVLCCRPTPVVRPIGLKQSLWSLVGRLSRGRLKSPQLVSGNTYWLLDTASGAAKRLGDIPGNPNTFMPSPDFRYAFTSRIGQNGPLEFYLLDFPRRSIQRLDTPSWGCDWWNESNILFRTTNCDLVLYDVRNKTTSPLIPFAKVVAFFQEQGLKDDPKQAQPFAIWNGRENDFYLTDTHQKWLAAESFLIKVERPDGKLRLISPHFKFEWSDHPDSTGRRYLYSARESGDGSDGVFLRDLTNGTKKTLVEPTTNKYHSIPRFYGDSVIYLRSNMLWRVGLDGTNATRLFPPQ